MQLFRLEMEYYFIHMAAAVGLTALTSFDRIQISWIFSIHSYVGNGIMNTGLQILNCLQFIGITLFFNGAP